MLLLSTFNRVRNSTYTDIADKGCRSGFWCDEAVS